MGYLIKIILKTNKLSSVYDVQIIKKNFLFVNIKVKYLRFSDVLR